MVACIVAVARYNQQSLSSMSSVMDHLSICWSRYVWNKRVRLKMKSTANAKDEGVSIISV